MKFLDKKRTNKLIHIVFDRIDKNRDLELNFKREILDGVETEVLHTVIYLDKKECKLITKIKDLTDFNKMLVQNINFGDQDGKIYSVRKINYFRTNEKVYQIKIDLLLVEQKLEPKEKIPHNYIAQAPNMKSNEDYEREAQTSGMLTTTQKYLNMNHNLIKHRDAIFDPNVIGEKDEDEETQKRVVDALDVLSHYLDDYKESNGIKTRIKE